MKNCPCGNDRNSPDVIESPEYSAWSMFLISMGISAKPVKVEYTCKKCKRKFDSLAPEELKSWVQ